MATLPPADPPENSGGPTADPPATAADPGRDYGCKYCSKRFTNKQALGGHQNAHKIQRALEKAARESEIDKPIEVCGPAAYPGPYHGGPYNSSRVFFDRYLVTNTHYNAYGPARPVPGCNPFLPRWTASGPRGIFGRFPEHGGRYVQNNWLNFRYRDSGNGSGLGRGMGFRPVYPGPSGLAASRFGPGGGDIRNGNNEDESGLDLSLKL